MRILLLIISLFICLTYGAENSSKNGTLSTTDVPSTSEPPDQKGNKTTPKLMKNPRKVVLDQGVHLKFPIVSKIATKDGEVSGLVSSGGYGRMYGFNQHMVSLVESSHSKMIRPRIERGHEENGSRRDPQKSVVKGYFSSAYQQGYSGTPDAQVQSMRNGFRGAITRGFRGAMTRPGFTTSKRSYGSLYGSNFASSYLTGSGLAGNDITNSNLGNFGPSGPPPSQNFGAPLSNSQTFGGDPNSIGDSNYGLNVNPTNLHSSGYKPQQQGYTPPHVETSNSYSGNLNMQYGASQNVDWEEIARQWKASQAKAGMNTISGGKLSSNSNGGFFGFTTASPMSSGDYSMNSMNNLGASNQVPYSANQWHGNSNEQSGYNSNQMPGFLPPSNENRQSTYANSNFGQTSINQASQTGPGSNGALFPTPISSNGFNTGRLQSQVQSYTAPHIDIDGNGNPLEPPTSHKKVLFPTHFSSHKNSYSLNVNTPYKNYGQNSMNSMSSVPQIATNNYVQPHEVVNIPGSIDATLYSTNHQRSNEIRQDLIQSNQIPDSQNQLPGFLPQPTADNNRLTGSNMAAGSAQNNFGPSNMVPGNTPNNFGQSANSYQTMNRYETGNSNNYNSAPNNFNGGQGGYEGISMNQGINTYHSYNTDRNSFGTNGGQVEAGKYQANQSGASGNLDFATMNGQNAIPGFLPPPQASTSSKMNGPMMNQNNYSQQQSMQQVPQQPLNSHPNPTVYKHGTNVYTTYTSNNGILPLRNEPMNDHANQNGGGGGIFSPK